MIHLVKCASTAVISKQSTAYENQLCKPGPQPTDFLGQNGVTSCCTYQIHTFVKISGGAIAPRLVAGMMQTQSPKTLRSNQQQTRSFADLNLESIFCCIQVFLSVITYNNISKHT